MRERFAHEVLRLIEELVQVDPLLILLSVILVCGLIVFDAITSHASRRAGALGLSKDASSVSVDGSKNLPVRGYISDIQGISGKPDALIVEDGWIIPVERKPLARKMRDRYVAQLLVYMRLVEEFEGKRPPYGYLILGPNCRQVKVENTPERQQWLQGLLDEMRSVLEKRSEVVPAPHQNKCPRCVARDRCAAAILPAEAPARGPEAATHDGE